MSGGGPSNVTQTTQTQLPAWLTNANQYGVGQAQNLYNQGGPQYYPGQQVASLNGLQNQYLNASQQLGSSGNPALNAATNYETNAANGAYLNANPYLNATFQNAANAVQNQVSSEFAGSGRNLEASIPVQNDQMNQLATQIYGGNYQQQSQLQQQAAAAAPLANQANLENLQQLGTAGSALQGQSQNQINAAMNQWNYNQNLPYNNLANYMNTVNSLSHGSTQTSTQPVYQNTAGSAMGGAATGAAIGTAIEPGMGTAVGAGLGLLGGLLF